MKRRQNGKIAKNKFFSLIGSQRKHIKPYMSLIFNWEFFWENTNVFWKLKFPLSSSRRNSNIYKVAKQLFSLLFVAYFFAIWPTYFRLIYKLFSFLLTIRCLLFSWKITLKIESLQFIYLILLLMSWELFRQKLAIMRKINIMEVVFKLQRVSIWDAVKGIWQRNTATYSSFGVLSPSGELQTKKWSQ